MIWPSQDMWLGGERAVSLVKNAEGFFPEIKREKKSWCKEKGKGGTARGEKIVFQSRRGEEKSKTWGIWGKN